MRHEIIRALKCYAGGQVYCLDVEHVLAIERSGRFTPNSETDGPSGWILRMNRQIPVYGLAERLGTGPRRRSRD